MGQVVVWGNGSTVTGRFKVPAGKTAVSATSEAQSGGIRVDWGGGDVVILPGESWTSEPIQDQTTGALWNHSFPINRGNPVVFTTANYQPPSPTLLIYGISMSAATFVAVVRGFKTQPLNLGGTVYYRMLGSTNWANIETFNARINGGYGGTTEYLQQIAITGPPTTTRFNGSINLQNIGYKVTTDAATSSQRETTTPPTISLESEGCSINIGYFDGNQTINLGGICPGFVRIEDASQCPPGSCSCDHRDYRCCIDSSSGQIIKKIRL
ncbi:hypothetical protein [Picosynechococcus sp. PCC 8807]|uniref:hypothetical protein n=1 Tax=Picosynechococcus sp. PCC 8807 TaxID=195248 RepID=UPI0012ED0F32|nr:hypothetical protein [Picosynechococcus sp. PCC 8807]